MSRLKRKKAAAAKRQAAAENRAAKRSTYRAKKWAEEHGAPPRTKREQQVNPS
jgi:hypothetical protein